MKLAASQAAILRQQLLARIQRSYVTTTAMVRVGDLEFPFTRITDPDRVLDEVAAEADRRERLNGRRDADEHLHLPYWAELWDSAMGIGQFIVEEDAKTRGRRDAEKGEGAGGTWRQGDKVKGDGDTKNRDEGAEHSGLVPASPRPRVPASSCIPASRRPRVPASSCIPASPRPRLPASSARSTLDLGCGMGLSGTIAAALGASVLFADIEPPALLFARLNSLPWAKRVRARRVNWQTDRLAETFSRIIGADILYERVQWPYLDAFWKHHLAPGGSVLLGEPGRQTGDLFLDWVANKGWAMKTYAQKVATRERPVRIFCLTRAGG